VKEPVVVLNTLAAKSGGVTDPLLERVRPGDQLIELKFRKDG
jgi:hypothetical protein